MSDDEEAPFILPERVMDRKAQRVPIEPPSAKVSPSEKQKVADALALKKSREAYEAKRIAAALVEFKLPDPQPVDIKVNRPTPMYNDVQRCTPKAAAFEPGPRPEMRWVEIALMDVDYAYQRPLSAKHAKKLAAEFKWLSFQPLSLVPKPNGRYAVVDGQHRLQACKAIPQIDKLPCYVVPAASQQDQARAFVEINDSHKRVSGLEKFRAALVAKDPITVAVNKACGDAGIKIISAGALGPMTTSSPALLVTLARVHGIPPIRRGLGLMAMAWPKEAGAFSKAMMRTVILTCRYGAEAASDAAMLKVMGEIKPSVFVAEVEVGAKEAGVAVGQSVLEVFFEWVTGREFSR